MCGLIQSHFETSTAWKTASVYKALDFTLRHKFPIFKYVYCKNVSLQFLWDQNVSIPLKQRFFRKLQETLLISQKILMYFII